jgi:hypothetical protein
MLPRASFLNDSFEYDAGDPDGYRSGAINVGKASGAKALAVKVFEIRADARAGRDRRVSSRAHRRAQGL